MQQDLRLNFPSPIVASDGTVVSVSDKGVVSVLFFQTRSQDGDHLHADVVAGVRLHNLKELEELQKQISDTIKQHKTREP